MGYLSQNGKVDLEPIFGYTLRTFYVTRAQKIRSI